jgi:hypothetical protein|tara:strand:+ start:56 stop:964 length:909 start_codon:yes stop_codon:yes gene_type:complete
MQKRVSFIATAVALCCSTAYATVIYAEEKGEELRVAESAASDTGNHAASDTGNHAASDTDKKAVNNTNKHKAVSLTASGYVGYRHDSNVSVSELDTNSDVADEALQTEAQLTLTVKPTSKWQSVLSVSQANTNYQTLSEFDLGLTTLSANTSYAFDFAKLGAHYYHANAKLDGNDFLTYQQYGLSAGKLFGQNTYLRLSTDLIDKQFDNPPEDAPIRDSDAVSLRSDLFYFFEGQDFVQLTASKLDSRGEYDGQYQTASSAKLMEDELDKMMASAPLNREQEKDAIEATWQSKKAKGVNDEN